MLKTIFLLALVGCLEQPARTTDANAAADGRFADAAAAPDAFVPTGTDCQYLSTNAPDCCQIACADIRVFQQQCAPVEGCAEYSCVIATGRVWSVEACAEGRR